MKTYISEIIPKIQKFSQKLDDISRLTNKHWVSIDEISVLKHVYIFLPNFSLIISRNGIVERGTWEYIDNQSLVLDTKNESYLLKHAFMDDVVLALRLDSSEGYAFFINQTLSNGELDSIEAINTFLIKKYLQFPSLASMLGAETEFTFEVVKEVEKFDLAWGNFIAFTIEFPNKQKSQVYKGKSSGKYFYFDKSYGKVYCSSLSDAAYKRYIHLQDNPNINY